MSSSNLPTHPSRHDGSSLENEEGQQPSSSGQPPPQQLQSDYASTTTTAAGTSPVLGFPVKGVFLQPSTFRVNATGRDILEALRHTSGALSQYLSSSSTHRKAAATPPLPPRPTSSGLDNEEAPSLPAALNSHPTIAPGGGVPTAAAAATPEEGGDEEATSSVPPPLSLAVEVADGLPNDIADEISRCLSGAGSTTYIVSFDYSIRPASQRPLTLAERMPLHDDPTLIMAQSEEINAMEEAIDGAPAHPTSSLASRSHWTGPSKRNATAATDEEIDAFSPATEIPSDQEGRRADLSCHSPSPRRRRCAEAVQTSLFAARRASRCALYLFEITPDVALSMDGVVRNQLIGGAGSHNSGHGNPLSTTPLLSGLDAALSTMLEGEEASFLLGPSDAFAFALPLDYHSHVHAAQCAAANAATFTASTVRAGSVGHGGQLASFSTSGSETSASSSATTAEWEIPTSASALAPQGSSGREAATAAQAEAEALSSTKRAFSDLTAYKLASHGSRYGLHITIRLHQRVPLLAARSISKVPTLLLSAEPIAAAIAVAEGRRRRTSINDVLLCFLRSNAFADVMWTTARYLFSTVPTGSAAQNAGAAAEEGGSTAATPSSRHLPSISTLGGLIMAQLNTAEATTAARHALLTAFSFASDGKLLRMSECSLSVAADNDTTSGSAYWWRAPLRVTDAWHLLCRRWQRGECGSTALSRSSMQAIFDEFSSFSSELNTTSVRCRVETLCSLDGRYYDASLPAGTTSASAAEEDQRLRRIAIGCIQYPCWLDYALQSGQYPTPTPVHVVTRGHDTEAEEQLFACAVLRDVSTAVQAIVSSFASTAASFVAAESTASAESALAGGSCTAITPATEEAGASGAVAQVSQAVKMTISGTPATRMNPLAEETLARRRLAACKQMAKGRRSERRFIVHVQQGERRRSSRCFYAQSAKEGLDAARVLLSDACALLQYYYDVVASWSHRDRTAPASAAPPSNLYPAPRLSARVEEVMRHPQLRRRAHAAQQHLPFLLLGEDAEALMAAFSTVSNPLVGPSSSAGADAVSCNPSSSGGVPDITLVAKSMLYFSASTARLTLATRMAMALQRILAKTLPRLYLAVLLLSLGVEERAVVPTAALQQRFAAWWRAATATEELPNATAAAMSATAGDDPETPGTPCSITAKSSGTPPQQSNSSSVGGGVHGASDEASARRCFRRYTYLGECFSYIALIFAEMPGMMNMASEAGTLALLYAPQEKSLWALRVFLRYQLADRERAKQSLDIAALLMAEEDHRAKSDAAERRVAAGEFEDFVQRWRQTLLGGV